jgi:hypothetical protein
MISGPASYVATTQEFYDHWLDVNTFLGANPLILEGGTTVAEFQTRRIALLAARDQLEEAALMRSLQRATVQIKKEWLLEKLGWFKTKVVAVAGASAYARVLPLVPSTSDGQDVFSRPMIQAAKLWKKINLGPPTGVTAPVLLKDGTTQVQFESAVAELATAYDGIVNMEQEVSLTLERRNDVQDVIYEMMKKYRVAVAGAVPDGNALLDTLPVLTPTSSRTPEAVSLAGVWNAGTSKADLTAEVSADADLKEYQLRACPGADYDTDIEAVVANIPKGQPPVFHTIKFLTQAGETASFRVYVVLTSGGEAGSNTAVVARP